MDDLGARAQLHDPLRLCLIEYRQKGVMGRPTLRPLLGRRRGDDPLRGRRETGWGLPIFTPLVDLDLLRGGEGLRVVIRLVRAIVEESFLG
ncbi:hypothetical protein LIER_19581 [Lithospermum erythrorhizon]|uniref:Uncharacterized protein n=1 Tax=Lithospermum erythrorhizon TaxID=34254 RepID=A0AAV3QL99_LITER